MRLLTAWTLLILCMAGMAQEKYFLPRPVVASNGRPINNANVDLHYAGNGTKLLDMTYLSGSAGDYYSTTVFADSSYDIYVNGVLWRENVHINTSQQTVNAIQKQLDGDGTKTGFRNVGLEQDRENAKYFVLKNWGLVPNDSSESASNRTKMYTVIDSAISQGVSNIYVDDFYWVDSLSIRNKSDLTFQGLTGTAGFGWKLSNWPSNHRTVFGVYGQFHLKGAVRVKFLDLYWTVQSTNTSLAWVGPILMKPEATGPINKMITVRGCRFDDAGVIYATITSGGDTSVVDFTFDNNHITQRDSMLSAAVQVRYSFNSVLRNNYYTGRPLGATGTGKGKHFAKGQYNWGPVKVHDNLIEWCDDSSIYFRGGNDEIFGSLEVYDNTIRYSGKDAIKYVSSEDSKIARFGTITNNTIYGAGRSQPDGGVMVNVEGFDMTVDNNKLYAIDTSGYGGWQVLMTAVKTHGKNLDIIENTIKANVDSATNLRHGLVAVRISGAVSDSVNILRNSILHFQDGVKVFENQHDRINVSYNHFFDLTQAAFDGTRATTTNHFTNVTLAYNIIQNCNDGFDVDFTDTLLVAYNSFFEHNGPGTSISDVIAITNSTETHEYFNPVTNGPYGISLPNYGTYSGGDSAYWVIGTDTVNLGKIR